MFPRIDTIADPVVASLLMAQTTEDDEFEEAILQARNYDSGVQFVALTERLRMFLGGDASDDGADWKRLRLNICHIVLSAVVDKLIVSDFSSDEPGETKPAAAYASLLWQLNRMDSKQRVVHEEALRDGESFVIVDWDSTKGRPRFTPHERFVDVSAGTGALANVGQGCKAYYRNDDPDQDLLFVTKRWTEVSYPSGQRTTRQRLTVYYSDRIEKYAGFPGAWKPTVDDDREPWPIPWTNEGKPLGIPAIHFRSSAGMEAREAWPIQNAINKTFVDLMTESDIAAFRILAAFGFKPVDSDGNPLVIEPGTWVGSEDPNGKIQEIGAADLSQFMNTIEGFMVWAATVTDTPSSRFITTKQVAAEGTQKEQNAPLLNKARNRQNELGDAWENAMQIAIRLENTFGKGGIPEDATLITSWQPLEARDEKAKLEQAKLRKDLGMPIELVAEGLGLSQKQIQLWQAESEARQAALIRPPLTRTVQRDGDGRISAVVEQ